MEENQGIAELRRELAILNTDLRELIAEHKREIEVSALIHRELQDMARRHEAIIYGNGKLGLITRVDRLEQTEQGRQWAQRAMWSAIFTAWAGLGAMLVTKFLP